MQIERPAIDALGGIEAVTAAVADLAAAWEAHALTVGVPAPSAHPLIEAIWRAGGMEAVEIAEPLPDAPAIAPRAIPALDFRRRFTPAERAAVTLAASRSLEQGDAALQVWLDDATAAVAIHLDDPEVADGIGALVALGLLSPERAAEITA
jgi:hypothetical protein